MTLLALILNLMCKHTLRMELNESKQQRNLISNHHNICGNCDIFINNWFFSSSQKLTIHCNLCKFFCVCYFFGIKAKYRNWHLRALLVNTTKHELCEFLCFCSFYCHTQMNFGRTKDSKYAINQPVSSQMRTDKSLT